MREISNHKTNICNEAIVLAADDPDEKCGNASHLYVASWLDTESRQHIITIPFQHGPIKEVGTNGLTNEVLLAVLIDRLGGFQSGAFACAENAVALNALETAMAAVKSRTGRRVAAGVEGTNVAAAGDGPA